MSEVNKDFHKDVNDPDKGSLSKSMPHPNHLKSAISDSTSRRIFSFHIFFVVLENKYLLLPSPFYESTITGCYKLFIGFIKPVFTYSKDEHDLNKKLTTLLFVACVL